MEHAVTRGEKQMGVGAVDLKKAIVSSKRRERH